MQPGETGFDWWHALSGMVGAAVGAGSTLLTWIIRAARMEPTIRAEIKESETRVKKEVDDKVDLEISHFRTTLTTLREKITQVEHAALSKDEFSQFRKELREDTQRYHRENREDLRALSDKVDKILQRLG